MFIPLVFYLETIGVKSTASIWEKSIWILAGNLNSGLSYLISTVKKDINSVEQTIVDQKCFLKDLWRDKLNELCAFMGTWIGSRAKIVSFP